MSDTCADGFAARNLHDLFPLPYTEEAAGHVAHGGAKSQDSWVGKSSSKLSTYVTFASGDERVGVSSESARAPIE